MTTLEVGTQLVALVREGKNREAIETLYHPDVVSIEAMSADSVRTGIQGALEMMDWWSQNMEVHSAQVEGPFPNGDEFAVYMSYDVTDKSKGARYPMVEVAVYTVADGKIVREKFYYTGG